MLFTKRVSVVVINRQSLEYFCGKDHFRLEFPSNVVSNLEITDLVGWKKLISDFKILNKIENASVIVLYSAEATFEKAFVKDETISDQIKKFYEEVPIPPEKLLKKEIDQEATVLGIAVNKEMFSEFLPILVVPLSPLGFKAFEWKAVADFRKLDHYCLFKSGSQQRSNKTSLWLFLFAIILAVGAAISYFYLFKSSEKVVVEVKKEIEVSPTPIATISASQSAKKEAKDLKIQVLNGSGKSGLAGKAKLLLSDVGFSNVETGNSTDSASVIKFKEGDFVASVTATLKGLGLNFATVSAELNSFDMIVNLGKN